MRTTYDRVKRTVAEQIGYDESQIKDTERLVSDLGADSLDHIELVMALEDEFEIEISDEDAEKFANATVPEIVATIDARIAPPSPLPSYRQGNPSPSPPAMRSSDQSAYPSDLVACLAEVHPPHVGFFTPVPLSH